MLKRFFLLLAILSIIISPCTADPVREADEKSVVIPACLTDKKILVAYFSHTAHTKQLAEKIHDITKGTLHQIKPKKPYTDDHLSLLAQATTEQHIDARPEIANTIKNMDQYDVIFLGYPIWWGDVPMIIKTFLESYDLQGKTIVTFCTYGSSGFTNSTETIIKLAPKAHVIEGFGCIGDTVISQRKQIQAWIESLAF